MIDVFRPTYQTADGTTRHSRVYYFRWKSKRVSTGCTDRRLAEKVAFEKLQQLELGRDPKRYDKAKAEMLVRLVAAYTQAMDAGEKQRYQVRLRLEKLTRELKARTLAELTLTRCQQWMRAAGRSRRTKHHYRVTLRAFGRWLTDAGHVPQNPFAKLEPVRQIEADRKLVRRALTADEFDALVRTAAQSRRRLCKLTGKQRAALYQVVAATGLRRSEVASLLPASFDLVPDGGTGVSTVTVDAAYTKNRTRAVLPLPSSLVPVLRAFLGPYRRFPDRAVWPLGRGMTSLMVKKDLAEAGLPAVMGGRSFDFHSLRGQYATRLALAGVSPTAAMKLLRHSDPRLTMAVYTHLSLADLSAEVEKLG